MGEISQQDSILSEKFDSELRSIAIEKFMSRFDLNSERNNSLIEFYLTIMKNSPELKL